MANSILTDVKLMCGVAEADTSFDVSILIYTNTVLANLSMIGVGPSEGFAILDATVTWDAFLGSEKNYNIALAYIYLNVRALFDPPKTSFEIAANEKVSAKYEWLLSTQRELAEWTDPTPPASDTEDVVVDGGTP